MEHNKDPAIRRARLDCAQAVMALLAALVLAASLPWAVGSMKAGRELPEPEGFAKAERWLYGDFDKPALSLWYPEDGPEPPAEIRMDGEDWILAETYPPEGGLAESRYALLEKSER